VDFTPTSSAPATAKLLMGLLLGLAALTVLGLLWMAHRVRARGRLGRVTAAATRVLGAPVLGLGGWSLALLVVLTTGLAVPLDDEALAVVAIGVAVGLTVGLGWADRGRTGRATAAGFAIAIACGLLGAWLGFHTVDGILAAATTLVGATVGANLGLLTATRRLNRGPTRGDEIALSRPGRTATIGT
jgi:hypothetical protein